MYAKVFISPTIANAVECLIDFGRMANGLRLVSKCVWPFDAPIELATELIANEFKSPHLDNIPPEVKHETMVKTAIETDIWFRFARPSIERRQRRSLAAIRGWETRRNNGSRKTKENS